MLGYGTKGGHGYGNQKHRSSLSHSYKGQKIRVIKQGGQYFAQAPELTSQYLGFGKTKSEAIREAKESIDSVKPELLENAQTDTMAHIKAYLQISA